MCFYICIPHFYILFRGCDVFTFIFLTFTFCRGYDVFLHLYFSLLYTFLLLEGAMFLHLYSSLLFFIPDTMCFYICISHFYFFIEDTMCFYIPHLFFFLKRIRCFYIVFLTFSFFF